MLRFRHLAIATLLLIFFAFAASCGDEGISEVVGAPCERNADCEHRCISEWPGGFCTMDCRSHDVCPDDTWCVDEKGGVCLFSCGSSAQCRHMLGEDYNCKEDKDFSGEKRFVCKKD